MLTAILVVVMVSVAYVFLYYKEIKIQKVENLKTLAKVLSTNLKSTLQFNDNQSAFEILSDLKSKNDLIAVELRNSENQIFAVYTKNSKNITANFNDNSKDFEYDFEGNFLYLQYPIFSENEKLGTLLFKMDTHEIDFYLANRVKLTIWIAFLALFIAFVMAIILQRQISKPLYKILNTIDIVRKENNYKYLIKLSNKDEIGKLSVAINEMLNQIDEKDDILMKHNKNLQQTVKERTAKLEENNLKLMQVNEDLVKAKIQAEQSKAVKELFLANMSHEIRTPLNAIIGFQQLLKNTELSPSQIEYVEAIDFAGRNLLSIINDILDLSKIESGKLEFESIPFSVKDTIESVVDLFKQKAKDKKIELIVNHDSKISENLYGDSTRFSQILINLLGNALKFTDKGSVQVTSFLSYENEQEVKCTFEVKDTGIGIELKNLPKIFERFSQASSDTSRLYGGTGLGLTICKFLVEGFGGRINVQSEKGKGSTFVFDIVLKKNEMGQKNQTKNQTIEIQSFDKKISILLAEDVEINQKLMKKIALNWGYDIDVAGNGEQVLEFLSKNDYDILLMDIQMPIMNGFVTCLNIRALENEKKRNIPIIALTAQASNAEAEKCINIGMNAYVSKPFDQYKLKETILRLLVNKEKVIRKVEVIQAPFSKYFDFQNLYNNAQGDITYVKDLFESFLENIPLYLEELNRAIFSKNKITIYESVHKIKSPILLFGLKNCLEPIKIIESKYKTLDWDEEWSSALKKLIKLIKSSIIELEKINADLVQ